MENKPKKSKVVTWTAIFDLRIYSMQAISKALKDYASFGTFTTKEIPGKIQIEAQIPASSDFNFKEEFSNYCLGMVIKCQ